jgi:hypothetical protein
MTPGVPSPGGRARDARLQRELYLPSGRQGYTLLLPVFGLLSAAAAGGVYGCLQARTLFLGHGVKLLLLWLVVRGAMVLGLALATTWPVVLGGKVLRVRSAATMRIYGAATAAFAVYFAWTFFAWQVDVLWQPATAQPLSFWCAHPEFVAMSIDVDLHYGLHLIALPGGELWKPTGWWLLGPWGLEAAAVIALSVRAAPRFAQRRGYCENCGRWLRPLPPLIVAADSTTGASPRDVRRGGLAALQVVEPPMRDALRTMRIEQQRCPGCGRGLWRALEQLHYTHTSPLRALFANSIWFGLLPMRADAKASDVVVPLCWWTDGDRAELDRIAAALAAHPLTSALRRRR